MEYLTKSKRNRQKTTLITKNRQSMTVCSLLLLLLLRITYLTTLGPKMSLRNISAKYSEETPFLESLSSGNIASKSAEFVVGSDFIVTLDGIVAYV